MSSTSSASKTRILLFLHSFGPGGVERVALRLAGAWADEGHDVRILMGRRDGPEKSIAPRNVIYDFAPPNPLARPFETLWMVKQLVAAVRKHRPDVLFCAGNTYTIVVALARLLLQSECPPVVCKFSNSLDRRDLPPLIRLGYLVWLRQHRHFIDHFVGLSAPMGREIQSFVGVSPTRVSVISNPVLTTESLNELSSDEGSVNRPAGRRFVSIGRLTRQKNFSLLLRAFAGVAEENDRLVIVGDGPQRKRLERTAARLGISGAVELTGYQTSVAGALKAADVFVTSSNYEGMPGAVIEALAAGIPIVATNSSSCVTHLLRDGEFGELVPIRDINALSDALHASRTRGPWPAAKMRSAAASYTVERAAPQYVEVLARTAKARVIRSVRSKLGPLAESARI